MSENENNNIIYNMDIPDLPNDKIYNTKTKRVNTLKSALKNIRSGKYNYKDYINKKLLFNTKDKVYVENKRAERRLTKIEKRNIKTAKIEKEKKQKLAIEKLQKNLNNPMPSKKSLLSNIKKKYDEAPKSQYSNISPQNIAKVRSQTAVYTDGSVLDIIKDLVYNVGRNTKYVSRIWFIDNTTGKQFSSPVRAYQSVDDIMDIIKQIVSSDEAFDLLNSDINIKYYDVPKGEGSVKIPKWLEKKRSVCLIKNKDDKCGHIAFLLGKASPEERKYLNSSKGNKLLYTHIDELILNTGLENALTFCDFNIIGEKYNYNITIYGDFHTILYETEIKEDNMDMFLFWDSKEEHYHLITDIQRFMSDENGNYKYCSICKCRFTRKQYDYHKCKGLSCNLCFKQFNTIEELNNHKKLKSDMSCPCCNLVCRGNECLYNHLKGTDKRKGCVGKSWFYPCCLHKGHSISKCWGRPEDKSIHKCDHKYCSKCDDYLPREHRCFIKPRKLKEKWIDNLIAFDFESRFDNEGRHYVNFIVAKERLSNITKIWRYEKDKDILQEFIDWCFTKEHTTFIAHNGKAYDTWLIHRKICSSKGKRPNKLVMAGNKIMYMKIDTICFIDSINHFSMALEKVPKTFGLNEDDYKKGFYPYLFNTEENWTYEGKIPDKKYYNYNAMKPKKRDEFMEWWDKKRNDKFIYNHARETEEYCISDVEILLEGCNRYSTIGYELTGIDPLTKTTIASWVMNTYLTKFYDFEKTPIAVLKKDEYDFIKKSFHGGRTETIRTYRKWTDEELKDGKCGRYVDITSLYPAVQFYDEMPCGEPKWVENIDYEYIKNNYGFYEIDIIMNNKEFISPLVSHYDGKLTADVEDKFNRVFHSKEIINAVEVGGCVVSRIHKGLVFNSTKDMFKEFVSTFLKIKVEASGEPSFYNLKDKTKRIKWEQDHLSKYGFIPKPEKTENSGLRAIAKMILNSLWGKFGQRPDMPTDKYIAPDKMKEWYKLIYYAKNDQIELKADEVSGDHIFISYIDKRESVNNTLGNTSIAIAASTTANAGIRLYTELKKLDKRVLYHDTDSIIYEYIPEEYNIQLGEYLGDWTCETDGKPIDEFVSPGAKSYAYKVNKKVKDTKMKGITLNYANGLRIQFDTMLELVNGEKDKLITTENIRFNRDKTDTSTLITTPMIKDVSMTMDKRDRNGYWTYPKGYVN